MPSLRLNTISFGYSGGSPVIRDATAHLDSGWTGVVGPNGSGKTTLLRLVMGDLKPDTGSIQLDPSEQAVICPQTVEKLTPAIEELASCWDGKAIEAMGRLQLYPTDLRRWGTLSPGERKRWQIGAALAREPHFLLLDEPTNHLDVEAKAHLLNALMRYRGVGLVVSHDRSFLNTLTRQTLRLGGGKLELFAGNYDAARADWEGRDRERSEKYEQIKGTGRELRRRLASQRRESEGRAAKHRTRIRSAGPGDHDARSMEAKIRGAAAAEKMSRQIARTQGDIERVQDAVGEFDFKRQVGRSVFFDYEPSPKRWLLQIESETLCAGESTVLRDVRLVVGRDDRVHLAGPNGAGKTTLLEALIQAAAIPENGLLYLPQELSHKEGVALLASVKRLPDKERGRVLSLVAALGLDPDLLLESESPSPGEARKLKMAYGLGTQVWCLLLDEPTNHLDLPAIERLQEALASYPGCLVMVTHDDKLAASCTDTVWEIRDQRIHATQRLETKGDS